MLTLEISSFRSFFELGSLHAEHYWVAAYKMKYFFNLKPLFYSDLRPSRFLTQRFLKDWVFLDRIINRSIFYELKPHLVWVCRP